MSTEPDDNATAGSGASGPPKALTHTDADGAARMVDVGAKPVTDRLAVAEGFVTMTAETLALCRNNALAKGDVLAVARLAGIQGAKYTSFLIPLCHGLNIDHVDIACEFSDAPHGIHLRGTARCQGRTGVEMEAMTAVSVAALAIYDMIKGIDRAARIERIALVEKRGGKSGHWLR